MNIEACSRGARRRFLTRVAAATLVAGGGCLTFWDDRGGPASSFVRISNRSSAETDVALLVRDEDADAQLLKRIVTVPSDESHRFDFEAESDEATISINAETEADAAATEQGIRSGDSTWFIVYIRDDKTVDVSVGMQ